MMCMCVWGLFSIFFKSVFQKLILPEKADTILNEINRNKECRDEMEVNLFVQLNLYVVDGLCETTDCNKMNRQEKFSSSQ